MPNELQGLTQLEEMLIAHVFPAISTYTKPGGQKAYKGHCINFSQDIQELANSLPRYPCELPVTVVSVKGKDNTYKDLTVRREKVSGALHWLVQHNPVHKDTQFAKHCLPQCTSGTSSPGDNGRSAVEGYKTSTGFNIWVFHPNAESYKDLTIQLIYSKHEDEKRLYTNRVLEVE